MGLRESSQNLEIARLSVATLSAQKQMRTQKML